MADQRKNPRNPSVQLSGQSSGQVSSAGRASMIRSASVNPGASVIPVVRVNLGAAVYGFASVNLVLRVNLGCSV